MEKEKLREAIENQDLEALKQLQAKFSIKQINRDLFGYGCTPLIYSISRGCSPMFLSYLIEAMGADPNTLDNYGQSPLGWAVEGDNLEALHVLLGLGADPNKKIDISKNM